MLARSRAGSPWFLVIVRPLLLILGVLLLALPASASADEPAVPELIQEAEDSGEISSAEANLYRAYALSRPDRVPQRFRSRTPWDGTLTLLRLQRSVKRMERGRSRDRINSTLATGPTFCDADSVGDKPNRLDTTHFRIDYDTIAPASGLAIQDYADSLERSWTKEVTEFGWAAPPIAPGDPAGTLYYVRVENLGSLGLYGYVSSSGTHAGLVGDNPNTSWNDGDAFASCMVLNADYTGFPSSPQASLDSTTAHEFNHSIQFGYGALTGPNAADDAFVEGGATWMEDEVHDAADDNYNYLWPNFSESMGEYSDGGFPYPYWIVFRGMTERFGTGVAAGGEDVMQRFWEETSKGTGDNLTAMQTAIAAKDPSLTLAEAFHDAAIAMRFNRACAGGYVLPYCLEEGPGYVAKAGEPPFHGTIAAVGGTHSGSVEDDYTLSWVRLPTGGDVYDVSLANTSSGGQLRATVACDTGTALQLSPLPAVVGAGAATQLTGFDPAACTDAVAVITNESQTAPNPGIPASRAYTLSTSAAGALRTLSVSRSGNGTVTSNPAGINCGSTCFANFATGTVVELTATPAAGSEFKGWGGACTGTGTCTVTMDDAASVSAAFGAATATPPADDNPPPANSPTPTLPDPIAQIDRVRPAISALSLSARRFRAARSGRAIAARTGTRVRYSLSEAATVTITIEQLKRTRTGRRRYVRQRGRMSLKGRAGPNAFTYRGRIGRRTLRPGAYRMQLVAKDKAGNTSRRKRITFRIVR